MIIVLIVSSFYVLNFYHYLGMRIENWFPVSFKIFGNFWDGDILTIYVSETERELGIAF